MKVTMNFDEDLISEIDERANKLHLSRTAYITITMVRAMQNEDLLDNMPVIAEFAKQMKKVDLSKIEITKKQK